MFPTPFAKTPLNLKKKCMIDNIRNKAIFEIKMAKNCSKSTKNWHFTNLTLTMHNENVFDYTTKHSGVSIFYSYRDLAWTKHKFKKEFFFQNFNNFWQNWILIFCCTTSVGMLFMDFFFQCFCTKGSGRYGLDKASVTYGQTDGRTYIHGWKNNICLRQGETYDYNSYNNSR